MAYDGLLTGAVVRELSCLSGAKIEKVQQPESDEIVLQVHIPGGDRRKLLISVNPQAARVQFSSLPYENPENAPSFCMLLRKHLQGGRISSVSQVETERIVRIGVDTVNELGFSVEKLLIAEIMGKHSNLILADRESGRIIDSIKRISIDVNRYRQILPGLTYADPPSQGKADTLGAPEEAIRAAVDDAIRASGAEPSADPARDADPAYRADLPKALMQRLQGFNAPVAEELCSRELGAGPFESVMEIRRRIESGELSPAVWLAPDGSPKDVHVIPLSVYSGLKRVDFDSMDAALDWFYSNRSDSNKQLQRSYDLDKLIKGLSEKQLHKKAKLLDELRKAEDADIYRLKGELLSANLHLAKPGDRKLKVISYYDGSEVEIELDERFSAAKNAQNYYKRYAKAKTAAKEKASQLEECGRTIEWLESLRGLTAGARTGEELDLIRAELAAAGFIRLRKVSQRNKKQGPKPRRITLSGGRTLLVGRSSAENDYITFKLGQRGDLWLHTKDIPGSHAVLLLGGEEPTAGEIYEAAAVAAWFSKGQDSQNVPVDYVPLKYVKKPAGARPGMVIFTNNRTVWVDPKDPDELKKR
ncbi:MAG: NFACT family protein [Firmicutes bacterium]|nr:NFACT family protein [Bacillota bacterium]